MHEPKRILIYLLFITKAYIYLFIIYNQRKHRVDPITQGKMVKQVGGCQINVLRV